MNGLESAIRNALERSDRSSSEMRARIYQSARHALEAGLRKQNITDSEVINEQRHRLEAIIHRVEQEERVRLEAEHVAAPEPLVEHATRSVAAQDPRHEPSVEFGEEEADEAAPGDAFSGLRAEREQRLGQTAHSHHASSSAVDHGSSLDVPPEAAVRRRKRRGGLFARLFVFATLFAAIGTGAWWVYTSDLLMSAAERDTRVPNPPPRAEDEDFGEAPASEQPSLGGPGSQQGFSDDWIEVFRGEQVADIRPGPNALVDVVSESDRPALRIISRSGDADGNVAITMPVAILREMAGKTSTIALTVQAAGDRAAQISVECAFDRMGDCARHRFTVNSERIDVLFRVTFERAIAPATPGRLLLNADLAGDGEGVNLYSVRVLPGS